jgi:hypothetical protein
MSQDSVGGMSIWAMYQYLMDGTALALAAMTLVICLTAARRPARPITAIEKAPRLPFHEVVAIAGFVAFPIFGLLMARLLTGVCHVRYVLPCAIGLSIAIALLAQLGARGSSRVGVVLAGLIAVCAGFHVLECKAALPERSRVECNQGAFALLAHAEELTRVGLPIVVTNIHAFHALQYYAPEDLATRLVYLCEYDEQGAFQLSKTSAWTGWRIESLDRFLDSTKNFYLYDGQWPGRSPSPLLARLLAQGLRVSSSGYLDLRDIYPRPWYLYRVTNEKSN